jgi:hypothetical protein
MNASSVENSYHVLLITGPSGVGKSAVAFEMHHQLKNRGISHVVIEGDVLDLCFPAPTTDPLKVGLTEANLSALWKSYREHGYTRMIMTGVFADLESDLHWIRRGLAAPARITAIRLEASEDNRCRRLASREIGSGYESHVASSNRAAILIAQCAGQNTVNISTDDLSVAEIATQLIDVAGWCG